jgi:tRNA U34 5-methylaminomethyl-2-thiouridine-forming methyltransferase MnmC
MKTEFTITGDGSHTLYLSTIDEHYHSTFGAIQESQHVYIEAGLGHCKQTNLEILEIGFGTGLNCYLTLLAAFKNGQTVNYNTIEKFPLKQDVWKKLNFSKGCSEIEKDYFSRLHLSSWSALVEIHSKFFLHKIEDDLLTISLGELPLIDLVYFDAFSPEKQPELWEPSIFEKIFSQMKDGGILVTYCAKGVIRRLLQQVGFQVERIPGPPGKREMLRATKRIN